MVIGDDHNICSCIGLQLVSNSCLQAPGPGYCQRSIRIRGVIVLSVAEVAKLLEPVSEDAPCGEDLEYDTAFGELERAAQVKAEQQFGETVVEEEGPNWSGVQDKALELFARTRDLRVAIYLVRAQVHNEGAAGLAALRRAPRLHECPGPR